LRHVFFYCGGGGGGEQLQKEICCAMNDAILEGKGCCYYCRLSAAAIKDLPLLTQTHGLEKRKLEKEEPEIPLRRK